MACSSLPSRPAAARSSGSGAKLPPYQAFLLPRSPLRRAATTVTVDQAGHAWQQKDLLPGIKTRRAEAPALAYHRHRHPVSQQIEQHGEAPYQAHIIALIGVLK